MKTLVKYLLVLTISILYFGCTKEDILHYDSTPPNPPSNIYTVTGDNRVDIFWDNSTDRDLAGYNVYYSDDNYKFTLLGSTENDYYVDYDAPNGQKVYYAITSYDFNGNESDLSKDLVYDTPRPEGFNQTIFDYLQFPNNSGYDFSTFSVLPYDDQNSDFFFENYNGTFYLDVYKDSDIQDMGKTNDIYDITIAPASGWSSTKDAIAEVGHTYVIWTWDNHFAKVRIKNITSERIVFDWAYQTMEGNIELKRAVPPEHRNPLDKEEFKNRIEKRSH
ncbi:MAG: hypothetical protein NTX22_14750 [Ignavibacteriales bacterium]|nr:hypothetical protein [Ignavibacteriales bacterium]